MAFLKTVLPSDCNGTLAMQGSSSLSALRKVQKVKVKLTLEQAAKAQRGSRGIAVLFP
jgi:hypothetical protein